MEYSRGSSRAWLGTKSSTAESRALSPGSSVTGRHLSMAAATTRATAESEAIIRYIVLSHRQKTRRDLNLVKIPSKTAFIIKTLVELLIEEHGAEINNMLDVDYNSVCNKLFENEINHGRIITFIAFSLLWCDAHSDDAVNCILSNTKLSAWLQNNRGWEFFRESKTTCITGVLSFISLFVSCYCIYKYFNVLSK